MESSDIGDKFEEASGNSVDPENKQETWKWLLNSDGIDFAFAEA